MRIKLDENLPETLLSVLAAHGHDVDIVLLEHLGGQDDPTVWEAAQTAARFLVTQDLDFSDTRRFTPGTHCGILLIRLRDPGRTALTDCIQRLCDTEDWESWAGCFVVVTERKLRVLRPAENSDTLDTEQAPK